MPGLRRPDNRRLQSGRRRAAVREAPVPRMLPARAGVRARPDGAMAMPPDGAVRAAQKAAAPVMVSPRVAVQAKVAQGRPCQAGRRHARRLGAR